MSNNLLTISFITNEGLLVLENNLVFADKVDRQYSDEFAIKGAKIGATCNVRRPPRYLGTFGPALNVEDTNETYVPVSLNYQFHVDVQFTTADLLLSMDLFRTRVLKPMMATVANRIDNDGLYFAYQNTAQAVGTFGVTPSSYLTFANADAQLSNEAMPEENRNMLLSPIMM
ncbi:MAG TPA: P22 phage major capsid protein family protein, partial [Nitrospiraceae bacterium]|nr:P22 phage major capsid protein family protein [Nitrospiraceae bacterium]